MLQAHASLLKEDYNILFLFPHTRNGLILFSDEVFRGIELDDKDRLPQVADIYEKDQIELLAIGIGHDVTKYYNHAITISNADNLGETLLDELTGLFE